MFCGMWQYICFYFFSRKTKGHVPTVSFVEQEARPPCAHRQKTWNQLVVRRLCCPHGTGTGAWRLSVPRALEHAGRASGVPARGGRRARCVPRTAGSLPIRPRHKANSIWRPRGRGDRSVINFFLCARPSHAGRTDPAREGCHVVAFAKPGPFVR